ncbi:GtrA family protein [Mariniluteicoccus flavus]
MSETSQAVNGKSEGRAARGFASMTSWIHRRLPRFLNWIPVTGVGFCILGLTTFLFDLVLLSIFKGWLHINYPLAVTLGYAGASVLNFILNRWLNFQVHGHVAKQSAKQAVAVISNYVIWILAFSSFLDHIGVHYQVARIVAACIEGVYLYVLMNFWVFPEENVFRRLVDRVRGRSSRSPEYDAT